MSYTTTPTEAPMTTLPGTLATIAAKAAKAQTFPAGSSQRKGQLEGLRAYEEQARAAGYTEAEIRAAREAGRRS